MAIRGADRSEHDVPAGTYIEHRKGLTFYYRNLTAHLHTSIFHHSKLLQNLTMNSGNGMPKIGGSPRVCRNMLVNGPNSLSSQTMAIGMGVVGTGLLAFYFSQFRVHKGDNQTCVLFSVYSGCSSSVLTRYPCRDLAARPTARDFGPHERATPPRRGCQRSRA